MFYWIQLGIYDLASLMIESLLREINFTSILQSKEKSGFFSFLREMCPVSSCCKCDEGINFLSWNQLHTYNLVSLIKENFFTWNQLYINFASLRENIMLFLWNELKVWFYKVSLKSPKIVISKQVHPNLKMIHFLHFE